MPGRAPTRFHTLVLPAIIAQSMIIGGGYATGREVVEYAGRFGVRIFQPVLDRARATGKL